jgi:hypothetical protein
MLNLKRSIRALLWIFAIIIGIEFIGLFCQPSPPPQPNNKNKTYQKDNTTGAPAFMSLLNNTTRGLYCIVDWVGTNSDAVIALATLAIAWFTFTLYKTSQEHSRHMKESIAVARNAANAADQSAKIAEKSLVLTQKAFVFVEDIIADKVPFGDPSQKGNCRITVVLKNSGGTRPENILCNIAYDAFPDEMPMKKIFEIPDEDEPIRAVIGPQASFYSFYKDLSIGILAVDLIQYKNIAYIWGWIDYDDVFEGTPRHRTEFCYEITLIGEGRIGFRLLYQGADNECYRQPSPYVPPK